MFAEILPCTFGVVVQSSFEEGSKVGWGEGCMIRSEGHVTRDGGEVLDVMSERWKVLRRDGTPMCLCVVFTSFFTKRKKTSGICLALSSCPSTRQVFFVLKKSSTSRRFNRQSGNVYPQCLSVYPELLLSDDCGKSLHVSGVA